MASGARSMASGALLMARPRTKLLMLFVLGCAVLQERAVIAVSTGGRGVLPLVAILAPLAAIATAVHYGRKRSFGFIAGPVFVLAVFPYLALTGLLPVLGVMFNEYPERTLQSITDATTAFSFLVIGAAISSDEDRSWSPWLLLAITLQFAYAAGQAVYLTRAPGWELFAPFHGWDWQVGGLLGQRLESRSIGLYINPNELGLWAGMAVILALTLLSGRLRTVGLTLGVLTLLLSQSRGATVALGTALVVGAALAIARGNLLSSRALKPIPSFGIAGLAAVSVALVIAPQGALQERFGALVQVFMLGTRADPNLAGRLDYWSAVSALNSVYPWGTWGSPELLLGTAVDSSWFRAFGQGSVPYVAAMALLILASLLVGRGRDGNALRLVAVLVAVAGLTQVPFGYPPIVLFWVLLGVGLESSVAARRSPGTAVREPAETGRAARRRGSGTTDDGAGSPSGHGRGTAPCIGDRRTMRGLRPVMMQRDAEARSLEKDHE
jgi:hypothetical protein